MEFSGHSNNKNYFNLLIKFGVFSDDFEPCFTNLNYRHYQLLYLQIKIDYILKFETEILEIKTGKIKVILKFRLIQEFIISFKDSNIPLFSGETSQNCFRYLNPQKRLYFYYSFSLFSALLATDSFHSDTLIDIQFFVNCM